MAYIDYTILDDAKRKLEFAEPWYDLTQYGFQVGKINYASKFILSFYQYGQYGISSFLKNKDVCR